MQSKKKKKRIPRGDKKPFVPQKIGKAVDAALKQREQLYLHHTQATQQLRDEEPSVKQLMKGHIGSDVYSIFHSLTPRGALGAPVGAYTQRKT